MPDHGEYRWVVAAGIVCGRQMLLHWQGYRRGELVASLWEWQPVDPEPHTPEIPRLAA